MSVGRGSGYWRFRVQSWGADSLPAELASVPGVKVKGNVVLAPRNAANTARLILQRGLALFDPIAPRWEGLRTSVSAKIALPFLQPWVPDFLTPYQRDGVLAALNAPGASLAFHWSAGSGKTLAGIIWALSSSPALTVVVTKAAIRGTWTREIDTYCVGVRWEVLEGEANEESASQFLAAIGGGASASPRPLFLITSYDTLPFWIGALEKIQPRSVVFDEAHHVKSWKRWNAEVGDSGEGIKFSLKNNRTAAAYRLSRVAPRRLALTATPISDRVRDLWSQLDLIDPWEWGSFYDFARRYCAATETSFGGIDTRGRSNLEELKERLGYVSHRVPWSVANRSLPPKRRLVTYVKVSEQVRADGFADDLKRAMRSAGSSAEGRARLTEILLAEAAARKRKIVEAWIGDALEAHQKVIVFTGRRRDCEQWAEEVRNRAKPGTPIWHADGSVDLRERYIIMDDYMRAPGPALLIGTGDAWGEGIGLQDSDLMILAMLPYTPRQIIQWEGRVSRLGQKRSVLIRYPICEGTIDERVASILLKKIPAVEKTIKSDEIAGMDRELAGGSEEDLIQSMLEKVLK